MRKCQFFGSASIGEVKKGRAASGTRVGRQDKRHIANEMDRMVICRDREMEERQIEEAGRPGRGGGGERLSAWRCSGRICAEWVEECAKRELIGTHTMYKATSPLNPASHSNKIFNLFVACDSPAEETLVRLCWISVDWRTPLKLKRLPLKFILPQPS